MAISKNQRALLAVVYLSPAHNFNFYHGVEALGTGIADTMGLAYDTAKVLTGVHATKAGFIAMLTELAKTHLAIDVIIILHGDTKQLVFYKPDGNHEDFVNIDTLSADIKHLGISKKLRLFYNLACYGATDNTAMIAAGFDTAIGALEVNTNGATELPVFSAMWVAGQPVSNCIATAMIGYQASDFAVNMSNAFPGHHANSYKSISGQHNTTINSNPL